MVYEFKVKKSNQTEISMKDYEGKVILVVNVASACGFTKQYDGLQKLYDKYHSRGLEILGFPCNQFGKQESGTNEEIQTFCTGQFGVTFPVLAKIDVNGSNADPLFNYLKKEATGVLGTEAIKWNFTKFLISKKGEVISRFAPMIEPAGLEKDIENLL